MAATHPASVTLPSEVKRNVKQPLAFAADAVTIPGLVVPV